jgi:PAP2 superfamily
VTVTAAHRAGLAWPRLPAAAELATIGTGYMAYSLVRLAVRASRQVAFAHAAQLWRTERWMHLFFEPFLNRLTADHLLLAEAAGYYYGLAHFLITPLVLAWLYLRRPAAFPSDGRRRAAGAKQTSCEQPGHRGPRDPGPQQRPGVADRPRRRWDLGAAAGRRRGHRGRGPSRRRGRRPARAAQRRSPAQPARHPLDSATRSLETIPTFAMAALAGIGAMPDTIEDRAVVVRMRRRAPGEKGRTVPAPPRPARPYPARRPARGLAHPALRRPRESRAGHPHPNIGALWLWIVAQIRVDHRPGGPQASRKEDIPGG